MGDLIHQKSGEYVQDERFGFPKLTWALRV